MKKYFGIVLMLFIMAAGVFAQVADSLIVIDPEIPVPEQITDLLDIGKWFGSLGALSGLAFFLGGLLNNLVKAEKKFVRQGLPILVAIVLAIGSDLVGFGYLKDAALWVAALHGLVAGFMSNGWFDLITGQGILKIFKKDSL